MFLRDFQRLTRRPLGRFCVGAGVVLAVCLTNPAQAYEGATRQEIDGGVHVPTLTKPPELVTFVEAKYPEDAQKQGLTAAVRMMVTIGADGAVADVQVQAPVGHGFDEAAVAAVKQFVFTPAEVDFAPSPVQIEYVYNFTLQAPEVDAGAGEAADAGSSAEAPLAHLKGVLIARGSRTRISGGLVLCANHPERDVTSNEQGEFALDVVPGLCDLRVVAAEFEKFESTEVVEAGETKELNLYVMPKTVGYETVVRGQRDKKEVVNRTLTRQELQKIPGTFCDPIRVIQNFPGVARAPFISGQLIVRGANPSQTLTFFDGVQIPLLFHFGGGPSVVNAEFLDRVDFFPGGFGARYGRAVGGVVDVASRKGASETWHGVAQVDIKDSSLFVEAPLSDKVSISGAIRRSYIDALLPLVLPKDPQGGALLILPVYFDYQVRLDVGGKRSQREASGSTFSVFAFGSDDRLKVVATGGGRNRDVTVNLTTLFHRVLGTWNYRRDNVRFKLVPYFGYDLASLDFGVSKIDADRWTQGLRQDLEIDATKFLTVRAGADVFNSVLLGRAEIPVISGTQYVDWPGADQKTQVQTITATIGSFDGAMYGEADFKFGPFTVTPGVRGSHAYVNGQSRNAIDPRLWVKWQPLEWTTVKGSVGLYSQPPDGANMQAPPFGTPSLLHEKAFQSSLGVAQKITDVINIDVTGFYNRRYENVVSPGPTTVNPDGSVTSQRFSNDGLGRAYGLEVLARHEVTKNFFGWVAYTLSRSEDRRAHTTGGYYLNTYDQTHILTVIGSYRLPYGFEIGGRFRYVTGRPKSPLIHEADLYNAESNGFSGSFGAYRTARVTDFHQLDIRIDKYFTFERWTLDVYLDVQNVYNRQNTEATIFDYRYRTSYDVPGIPFLPVLGFKASF